MRVPEGLSSEVAVVPVVTAALSDAERAGAMKVSSMEEFTAANESLIALKSLRKKVQDYFEPMATKAHAAWKEITNQRGIVLKPIEAAEKALAAEMGRWMREEDARVKAEQERLRREALDRMEETRLQEALAAEAAGEKETADRILSESAPVVPTPSIPSPKQELKGLSSVKVWRWEVTDKMAFILAVSAGIIPPEMLEVNQRAMTSAITSFGESLKWPGVRVWQETTLRATGRA